MPIFKVGKVHNVTFSLILLFNLKCPCLGNFLSFQYRFMHSQSSRYQSSVESYRASYLNDSGHFKLLIR